VAGGGKERKARSEEDWIKQYSKLTKKHSIFCHTKFKVYNSRTFFIAQFFQFLSEHQIFI
jgi:hypothetical protein